MVLPEQYINQCHHHSEQTYGSLIWCLEAAHVEVLGSEPDKWLHRHRRAP